MRRYTVLEAYGDTMRQLIGPHNHFTFSRVQRISHLLLNQAEWQRRGDRRVVLPALSPDAICAASINARGWHVGQPIDELELKGAL
jgi:hypothetical protein